MPDLDPQDQHLLSLVRTGQDTAVDLWLGRHPTDLNRPFAERYLLNEAAMQPDSSRLLRVLIAHGADPRHVPNALLNAVHHNDRASVDLLVQHGADPRYGNSRALDVAGEYGLTTMFQHLLDLGASEQDHRGALGRMMLTQHEWSRVMNAAKEGEVETYRTAWATMSVPPPAPLALIGEAVGHPWLDDDRRAKGLAPRRAILDHALTLVTPSDLTAHGVNLLQRTLAAGNVELVAPLEQAGLNLGAVDLDAVMRHLVTRPNPSFPLRWAWTTVRWLSQRQDHPVPEDVRTALWDSLQSDLNRQAQHPRPDAAMAILDAADGWGVTLDLQAALTHAVDSTASTSETLRALAARAPAPVFLNGMVRAVQRRVVRAIEAFWNEGVGWPLTGTPSPGFEEVGVFPMEVLLAAVQTFSGSQPLDWLTERGARWLPHEAALRAAAHGEPLNWLNGPVIQAERVAHERRTLHQVVDTLHTGPLDASSATGPTEAPGGSPNPSVRARARL